VSGNQKTNRNAPIPDPAAARINAQNDSLIQSTSSGNPGFPPIKACGPEAEKTFVCVLLVTYGIYEGYELIKKGGSDNPDTLDLPSDNQPVSSSGKNTPSDLEVPGYYNFPDPGYYDFPDRRHHGADQ
jgi:hypothetical protein